MSRTFWGLSVMVALLLQGSALSGAMPADDANQMVSPSALEGLQYRSLGFTRGGRSTAGAGVPGEPLTYYFGSTGGGVWKTTDAGNSWKSTSDEFFKVGSIGSVAVASSDPNVIYVGTGSACPRGNISSGNGMYRSTDAGKTWSHIGLDSAGQIGRIRIHPNDPDHVYAAVLGNIFGPNPERGVYRSRDGGKNWEKVFFVSEKTGAVDLAMDPKNPRILYAAMWTVERKPWTLMSGSEEGGLFKSTDGGDNWEKLKGGLPTGVVGKIGVSVSGANSDRVYAIVEAAKDGGVYRSDDAGKNWRRQNTEARLLQRPWYYNHIIADTQDENTVYVLNTGMYRSTDGGKSYESIRTQHGDNHDLWISPVNNQHMIETNDGGANVSLNGGASWSTVMNQPTAEIYRVTVDNQFPYRVYGAQQDNSTISVPSRAGFGVVEDWYQVGGCESGHIAVDPRNPDIVYAGCYGGEISRVDLETDESRSIIIYPQLQLGQAPKDLKYRFQWNAPIRVSPHPPYALYHTSQMVHRSLDEGQSWETISGDLTRNEESRQGYAGEPITHDSTGVEVYGVIFAFEESPLQKGLLWAGSDDGRVHVSKDDGKTWEDITPSGMPEWGTVNMIDLSAHDPGRAFIAVQKYREADFSPYIFRTSDYGKTWDRLTDGTNGIPADHFVRVVREDPDRKGLLYAGTEFGIYVSFDDGAHWQSFQLNLPRTPVTDLAVYRKDLVVSTQGRAFWVIDDLSPLHQLSETVLDVPAHLFAPRAAYRAGGFQASIYYHLKEKPEGKVSLQVLDSKGGEIAKFDAKEGDDESGGMPEFFSRFGGGPQNITAKVGLNRFAWNLRYPRVEIPRGVVVWGGAPGASVVPGQYQVKLSVGEWNQTVPLEVMMDPRSSASQADLEEQFKVLQDVSGKLKQLYDGLEKIRSIRTQVGDLTKRIKDAGQADEDVSKAAEEIQKKITEVEENLTQVKSKSSQDPLNFPPMIDNQFVELYGYVVGGNARPTKGAYERLGDLNREFEPLMARVEKIASDDLKKFNEVVRKKDLGPVILSSKP